MTALTPLAKEFLAKNPTFIGTVRGHRFYEHPVYGDEATLICITAKGRKVISEFWELPEAFEIGHYN